MKLLFVIILSISLMGCSRRVTYKRTLTHEDSTVESVSISYRGPWGNSETTGLKISLDENTNMSVGTSTTNMDKLMETMEVVIPQMAADLSTCLKLMYASPEVGASML